MITEDYVSFEVAKLLKEKGFEQNTNILPYYTDNGNLFIGDINTSHIRYYNAASAPTLQMALKWLREVHNIHIIIHRYPVKLNYSDVKLWYPEIITLTSPENVDKQFFLNEENDTYEAACEAAIKYCLTNLI